MGRPDFVAKLLRYDGKPAPASFEVKACTAAILFSPAAPACLQFAVNKIAEDEVRRDGS